MGWDYRSAKQQLTTCINQLGDPIVHLFTHNELELVEKSAEDDILFFDLIHETK